MTVSWMIACASFTAAPLLGRRFSLSDAVIAFASAAVLTVWLRGLGGRNYRRVALHLIVLTLLLAHALHKFFHPSADFFDRSWIHSLYGQMHRMTDFLAAALVAGWTAAFWAAGAKLARRPLDYPAVCRRFDTGLTVLFVLLLVQLVLVTRGGVSIAAPPQALFTYGFFVCGLTAIGLVRSRGMTAKRDFSGYRGVAILLVLSSAALAATGLLAALAPPVLTPAAEDGYRVLKIAAKPLGAIITRFLLFIFGRQHHTPVGAGTAAAPPSAPVTDSLDTGWIWLAHLMARGLLALMVLALLALLGLGLRRLVHWLLQKVPGRQEPSRRRHLFFALLQWLLAWARHRFALLRPASRRFVDIGRLFAKLQKWGRLGGVGRNYWETPAEYAERLAGRFPRTAADVSAIVEAFEQKVYGERPPDRAAVKSACDAWRRLRSPRHWPSRWRALFDRP